MSDSKQINIPDIGDFSEVEVIEVLVKVGDTVDAEDAIISLESEKATIEVPTPEGGVVEAILVKVGDMVAQGTPMLTIKTSGTADSKVSEPVKSEPTKTETKTEKPKL